jgi:hypothetical protein
MRKLMSILGIGLMAAACSTAGASGTPGFTPASHYNVATGADQLVLQVTTGGGNVPIAVQLTHTPWFALYGDGRVVVKGPVVAISPAPLLPNLRQMHVTQAEVQKIVGEADRAGLLGPDARFDAVDIYDASTTVFTTIVDGKTHTIRAYALDYDVEVKDRVVTEARQKLSGFERQISGLAAFLGREVSDADAYDAAVMRVFTSPIGSSDPDILTRQVVAWPLNSDPGTAGEAASVQNVRCLALTGPDLETFLTVARTANSLTTWTYGAGRYSVYVRPLYPDESGCPAP